MDVKTLDEISRAAAQRAIHMARSQLHIPVSYQDDPTFFEGPEFQSAIDALGAMMLAYERHARIMADPDACASGDIDMSKVKFKGIETVVGNILPPLSGRPYPPKPTVYLDEGYGEGSPKSNRIEIFSTKSGYAHKTVSGKLASGMTSGNALLMLQHEYDPMPFGYRGFNYNEQSGCFVITIHTD